MITIQSYDRDRDVTLIACSTCDSASMELYGRWTQAEVAAGPFECHDCAEEALAEVSALAVA